ncbi:hypothetical protein MKQ70_05620 [Chitinophaga sedimenti]|nr:hypothetical protein [Chitinophaga sedimenti]
MVNLVQHITETIFFFNPGLLWISALLKEEREACCDEMVLDQTRGEDAYMQALVSFQEFTLTQNSYAMSLKDHPGQLFIRIQRMITGKTAPSAAKVNCCCWAVHSRLPRFWYSAICARSLPPR